MEIYGEYLFLENFITGILLLLLTGRLSGEHPVKIRLFAGGLICGMSGFLILLPIQVSNRYQRGKLSEHRGNGR